MEAAVTSEVCFAWAKCRSPLSTDRVPLALSLTPTRPVSWTTFTGFESCSALAMEITSPAKSNTAATKLILLPIFMHISWITKFNGCQRTCTTMSETSSVGGPLRQAATPSRMACFISWAGKDDDCRTISQTPGMPSISPRELKTSVIPSV